MLGRKPLTETSPEEVVASPAGGKVEQPAVIQEFETQRGICDPGRIDVRKLENTMRIPFPLPEIARSTPLAAAARISGSFTGWIAG